MDEILNQISEILARLQDIAPEVYAVYRRQALVDGWVSLFIGLLMTAIVGLSIYVLIRHWRTLSDGEQRINAADLDEYSKHNKLTDLGDAHYPFIVGAAIVLVVVGVAALLILPYAVFHLANTDYYAIEMLLGR